MGLYRLLQIKLFPSLGEKIIVVAMATHTMIAKTKATHTITNPNHDQWANYKQLLPPSAVQP